MSMTPHEQYVNFPSQSKKPWLGRDRFLILSHLGSALFHTKPKNFVQKENIIKSYGMKRLLLSSSSSQRYVSSNLEMWHILIWPSFHIVDLPACHFEGVDCILWLFHPRKASITEVREEANPFKNYDTHGLRLQQVVVQWVSTLYSHALG